MVVADGPSSCSRQSSTITSELVEHYASKGFVVLAPEHVEADWLLAAAASFARPRDVSRTLDLAELLTADGGALAGLIADGRAALLPDSEHRLHDDASLAHHRSSDWFMSRHEPGSDQEHHHP
jgi:hypothetical protein